MAIFNKVRLSMLEDDLRFDSQYYTPENIMLEQELSRFDTVRLGSVALITDGQHGYFKLDENSNIRQITAKCIVNGVVDKSNADHLSEHTHKNNLRSSLVPNDVLITTAGTIGQVGLVTDDIPPANIDQDIGRIAVHDSAMSPLFIWAFLQSKFGQYQVARFTTGQVQTHLSLTKMKKLHLPLLDSYETINGIVESFINAGIKSRQLYLDAQQLLESELKLDEIRFEKPIGYSANFNTVFQEGRADAEYHNPQLRKYWQHLSKRHELLKVSSFGKVLKFSNPEYGSTGLPIVTQKHLQSISPSEYGDDLRTTDSWQTLNPSAVLQENDLLFYSVGAYLGKTNIWLNTDKAVHASFITMLRCPLDYDAGYLHVLLNSKYGILQSKCFQSGTSQQYIYPKDIRKFLIPVIPRETKMELHRLVSKSYEAEIESKSLFKTAQTKVEQMIEEANQL